MAVSIVTVLAVVLAEGPAFEASSTTLPELILRMTVPSLVHVTVTVRLEPESDPGSNVHVAVPVFEKSAASTSVTDSEKDSVYVNDEEFVGDDCDDENDDTVGAVVSITIALLPAMLFAPEGTDVDVIAFPAVSATVPIVNELTVKSDDVSPACTVYVPVNVVPAEAAVNVTVRDVSSVTVNVFPDCTASLVVAVTFTDDPALYEPSAVDDENDDTVGAIPSITRALLAAKEFAAPGVGSAVSAAVPVLSMIEPPFNDSAAVET